MEIFLADQVGLFIHVILEIEVFFLLRIAQRGRDHPNERLLHSFVGVDVHFQRRVLQDFFIPLALLLQKVQQPLFLYIFMAKYLAQLARQVVLLVVVQRVQVSDVHILGAVQTFVGHRAQARQPLGLHGSVLYQLGLLWILRFVGIHLENKCDNGFCIQMNLGKIKSKHSMNKNIIRA